MSRPYRTSHWYPDALSSPHARKRYTVRLYPAYRPRLRAVAEQMGMTVAEYIEHCVERDERRLGKKPTQAAIGRALLRSKTRADSERASHE